MTPPREFRLWQTLALLGASFVFSMLAGAWLACLIWRFVT